MSITREFCKVLYEYSIIEFIKHFFRLRLEVMSTSTMRHPSGSELGRSAGLDPVVGGSEMSNTRTMIIVFGILGIALAFATVVVAFLQYRLQNRRMFPDAERDSDSIQMSSQRSFQEQGIFIASRP
jgi:hypothetical protein